MSAEMIQNAIAQSNNAALIEFLEDKTLPIQEAEKIYNAFKTDKQIVGQVAANLSFYVLPSMNVTKSTVRRWSPF